MSNNRANAIESDAMPAAGAQSLIRINRMRGVAGKNGRIVDYVFNLAYRNGDLNGTQPV
ncbi:hypothetical protein B0G69_5284 [Paraburkholderia sp. RAU2J]|nr:hypothetical protein B0G69_5284 [Paraburkholderia sp. RAU2J]